MVGAGPHEPARGRSSVAAEPFKETVSDGECWSAQAGARAKQRSCGALKETPSGSIWARVVCLAC